jgi:transcriptional regulator with XRE-family HTH domain
MNWKEGKKIKEARLKKGLTQLQLAVRVNVSISTISNMELAKKQSVSTGTLDLISKELGIKFEL